MPRKPALGTVQTVRPAIVRRLLQASLEPGSVVSVVAAHSDGNLDLLVGAQHRKLGFCPRLGLMQVGNQLGRVVHFLTVELNDQIAGPQAGTRCGAVRKNLRDSGALLGHWSDIRLIDAGWIVASWMVGRRVPDSLAASSR